MFLVWLKMYQKIVIDVEEGWKDRNAGVNK